MDWGAFEREARAEERSPRDGDALLAAARAIVAVHGETLRPKDVDAFVRARTEAGASIEELALAQRAGELLARFLGNPAPPETPAPLPPELLAKMPASYFARAHETPGDEDGPWRAIRRHAWLIDVAAIGIALILFGARLSMQPPPGAPYDVTQALLRRVIAWVSGLTLLAGASGFADRAGLLEGPLYGRFGDATLRLRLFQARGLLALRGVMILLSCVLLVAIGVPHGSAPMPSRSEPGEWPAWMTELDVLARPPSRWTFDHASVLSAEEQPVRVAWMTEGGAAPPVHAIATTRSAPSVPFVHAVAMALSAEIPRRTDGITCHPEPPATHAIALCVRQDAPGPFVIACDDHPGNRLVCVASWGAGSSDVASAEVERVLRDVLPRGL